MKAVADRWAARAHASGDAAVDIAAKYAVAGERDLAFKWFDVAFSTRRPTLLRAAVHLFFDRIRNDPRFGALRPCRAAQRRSAAATGAGRSGWVGGAARGGTRRG